MEFVPFWKPIYSSQYDKNGEQRETRLTLNDSPSCEEVTEDFYQTGHGKYWLNLIKTLQQFDESIPVLPTGSLTLLPTFHAGEAAIVDGKEITQEEFQSGEAVCLIATDFAQLNNLKVGDSISIPLFFANYRKDPGEYGMVDFSLLNAQGEPYSIFWKSEYKIVGTYRYSGGQAVGISNGTEMGRDMVIIPSKSVKASDENNIVDYGPMRGTTTSFQIPNGSIAEFQAAFIKAVPESSLLEVTYNDNGYEQIRGDLKSTRDIAVLLGAIGFFSTISILMLLLYFFVIKQKKRTAIERSLGMSRRQCRISIISGIMILTIAATILGSIVSSVLIQSMLIVGETKQTGYSTMYSSWAREEEGSKLLDRFNEDVPDTTGYLNFAVPAVLLLFMLTSSVILVNRNLSIEPILLLSSRGD